MTTTRLHEVALQHGFSDAAVAEAAAALGRGLGGMAQFDHADLGGRGQWMAGGMVTIGRTGDRSLPDRVAALFAALSAEPSSPDVERRMRMEPMKPMPPMRPMAPMKPMEAVKGVDAPAEWGQPSSAGGQNDVRYAYFEQPRRLVVERAGQRTVYDTGEHRISGVAQDQFDASAGRLAFTSDRGTVSVGSLKQV